MKKAFENFALFASFMMLVFTGIVHAQNPAPAQSDFQLLSVSNIPIKNFSTNNGLLLPQHQKTTHSQNSHNHSTNDTPSNNGNINVPEVRFSDCPITTAIENLARISGINYCFDPNVSVTLIGSPNDGIPEPMVTCHIKNVAPKEVLNRLLNLRGFVLIENRVTTVTCITQSEYPFPMINVAPLNMDTNNPVSSTNDIIPQIRFTNVPIDTGLENLLQICGLKADLDPILINGKSPRDRPPILNLRWENITAKQAIVAICQINNLTLSKGDSTNVIRIKPRIIKRHHRLQLR